MSGPMHFEVHAASYARARLPYPAALWDRVRDTGLVGPGRRAVDLGAGTGEATGPLLAAGMEVLAVEPGVALSGMLKARHPRAEVVVARAEDVDLAARSFDLAVAATAIHWMNLDTVLPKVHRALRPDGRFLVWRQVFGNPDAPVSAFRERVAEIVRRRHPPRSDRAVAEDAVTTAERLSRSGLFAVEDVFACRWSVELDAERIEELFLTFSDWSVAEAAEAGDAVREMGGSVVEHYSTWLTELRPTGPRPL